jgi:hypothetical protein
MGVPEEIEDRIAGAPVSAHVATSVDGRPHVAPVWYGYRGGTVYFLTGGKKVANARRNPRVALSIESADGADVAWNAVLLGRATVEDDPERVEWAKGWIYGKYDADGGETEPKNRDPDDAAYGGAGYGEETYDDDRDVPDGGEGEYALVSVRVGSATLNDYA